MKRSIFMVLMLASTFAFTQKQNKPAVANEGLMYFSFTAEKNGKTIYITKDYGRTIDVDSLKMADKMAAYYKVGQKVSKVKDMTYDSYFLNSVKEPTVLQEMYSSSFDNSIWVSVLDSMANNDQVVIQVKEITLEDGTKIQHPKLAKPTKATYRLETNPNFPPGGWEAKANHWISTWKEWFNPTDKNFYKLDDKTLELYTSQIVYTIKKKATKK